MKVIFLDIDGVLNNDGSIQRYGTNLKPDPENVAQLNRVAAAVDARIVVTSNWREQQPLWRIQAILGQVLGVTADIIGMTPDLKRLANLYPEDKHIFWVRPLEIERWLRSNPWVSKYAMIDDHAYKNVGREFCKTDPAHGLTKEIADSIIEFFEV